MSVQAARPTRPNRSLRLAVAIVAAAVLLAAMIYDTRIVRIGSGESAQPGTFSPAAFGAKEFPAVQAAVDGKAVEAATLADAIAKDPAAAAKQYGVTSTGGTVYPVKFTGVAGKGDFGVYDVAVPGLPDTTHVKVQTGPAILGTDLRDATGTISFGQFTNQIEYQNAGSALNKEMKKQVLSKLDTANLTGKTVAVVGAFRASDATTWTVTPVKMEVK